MDDFQSYHTKTKAHPLAISSKVLVSNAVVYRLSMQRDTKTAISVHVRGTQRRGSERKCCIVEEVIAVGERSSLKPIQDKTHAFGDYAPNKLSWHSPQATLFPG
ncbi:hypothetical protein CFAM422_006430 [Trichoderma lentiforme]|uniref:Uncharacterized protein n=1 Tax=Trichoderma lentiforme TaxID=1567552 RepID=A0A9P4XEW6_9HYPO|nr:hypothetical protein CFAM422_006430 [Trichoderma lentiforme]